MSESNQAQQLLDTQRRRSRSKGSQA